MSYLHPSQRAHKTGQIGPSGHSNNYHVGVLEGNWFEERNSFGPQPQRSFKFTASSEAHNAFPPQTAQQISDAKPPMICAREAPRRLLLGQGEEVTSMFSVAELSFRNTAAGESPLRAHEVIAKEGNSPRRHRTIDQRIENGTLKEDEAMRMAAREAAAADAETSSSAAAPSAPARNILKSTRAQQQYLTTKNLSHDATGEYMIDHPEAFVKGKCNARGPVIKMLDHPMMRTGLRQ